MEANPSRMGHRQRRRASFLFAATLVWLSLHAPSLLAAAPATGTNTPSTTSQPKTSQALSAEEVQKHPAPQGLSETERQLAGTWTGTAPIPLGDGSVVERYFFSLETNGTYRVRAQVRRAGSGVDAKPSYLVNTGRWSASRGLYTMVLTQAGDGTAYDMQLPKAATVHLIRELSANRFVIQIITTGQTMEMARLANQGRAAP